MKNTLAILSPQPKLANNLSLVLSKSWLLIALLASSPCYSFFPIDVTPQLNQLDVSYLSGDVGNIATLEILNNSAQNIKCRAVFRNGPEPATQRQAEIEAKGRTMLSVPFQRTIIRVRVHLECVSGEGAFDINSTHFSDYNAPATQDSKATREYPLTNSVGIRFGLPLLS